MLPFFPRNRALRPEGLLHSRGIARSGLRPLTKIPYCCLPQESGPCLSPNVAVRPLRPAMHHRLGGPLPRQQTNAPQVHPRPIPERMFHRKKMPPSCTSGFVLRFQSVFPVRGQVPYVLLTRSPLETRRSLFFPPQQSFTTRRPSSLTRHRSFRLAPIDENSLLLPPAGVWAVSQSQCGRPPSQAGYASSSWWAFTPPTN